MCKITEAGYNKIYKVKLRKEICLQTSGSTSSLILKLFNL